MDNCQNTICPNCHNLIDQKRQHPTHLPFVTVPMVASLVARMIGFGGIDGSLRLKVVIILSSIPVAFTALIPPSIYNLDIYLANACGSLPHLSILSFRMDPEHWG
jgi:hypothetical protein